MVPRSGSRLVIFSRSGETEYRWLLDILREDWVVSTFTITNSNHSLFCKEVYSCSFAILYHSRNRGRVNITDVTDSLYDEEVKTMFEALGKERVITVIDDLDDSSEGAKERILGHQRSLKTLTQGIFLFTREDKASNEVLRRRVKSIKDVISHSVGTRSTEVSVDHISKYNERSLSREPSHAVLPLFQGSDPPASAPVQGNWRKLLISALSLYALRKSSSESPVLENGILLLLWAAATARVFCIHNSRPVIPLIYPGRIALFSTITFFIVSDTYYRPSALNVVSSAVCIVSYLGSLWPRRQQCSNELSWKVIHYGIILLIFWKSWQQTDAETTLQKISQFVLRSPVIPAAVGI
ncbi:uncharacterized protein [Eleutherodactylus coqui]|uniref:uncharacterized protein isoform X1 n=1 Tax=Eleutherodactylus coqui TaxID=57060 RepID=UPI00346229A4